MNDCTSTRCGPPSGSASVITDVVAILDKFKNLMGAPLKARTDLEPSLSDPEVAIAELLFALRTFTDLQCLGSYRAIQAASLNGRPTSDKRARDD